LVSVSPPPSSWRVNRASIAATCRISSALPVTAWLPGVACGAGLVAAGVELAGGAVGVVEGGVVAGDAVAGEAVAGDVVLGGVAGVLGSVAAGFADGEVLAAAVPPAAFSKSLRLRRKTTSFARTAGSRSAMPAPDVPTAPGVPDTLGSVAASGPISALRFAETFAYDARHSACVVISSLKLEMSCATCERASPASCDAAGSCVKSLRVFRASVKCWRAACSLPCVLCGA
jgi:hypothetical protein